MKEQYYCKVYGSNNTTERFIVYAENMIEASAKCSTLADEIMCRDVRAISIRSKAHMDSLCNEKESIKH